MDTVMQIIEETPTKLVLEKSISTRSILNKWGKPLIYLLLFLAALSLILFIRSNFMFNNPSWLYWWIIAVVVFLIEAFVLYIFLISARKTIVTIDLHSKCATRIEKLFISIQRKKEVDLEPINRVLIHCEEVARWHWVTLDSQNHSHLEVDSALALPSNADALRAISIKIGEFLNKPVSPLKKVDL